MKLFIPESEWGNLITERKQHGMSFWGVLGFEVCFSPYFLTVGDENRERKYQHLALWFKREEEVANLVREVKVLPEEVCFHLHWSWVGCFDVWNLFNLQNRQEWRKVSQTHKKKKCFILHRSFWRHKLSKHSLGIRLLCKEIQRKNGTNDLNFWEVIFSISFYMIWS